MTTQNTAGRRESAAAELDRMVEALTVPQLLDIAAALGKSSRITPKKHKDDIVSELKTIIDFDTLSLTAHRIEAMAPFKHAFLFTFDLDSRSTVNFEHAKESAGELTNSFETFDLDSNALNIQTVIVDDTGLRLIIKFVHVVTSAEWAKVSPTERRLRKVRERHPVTVILRFQTGLASICFPGFTQGGGTGHDERVSYDEITLKCVEAIKTRFNVSLTGLTVRPSLEALLSDPQSGVVDRGRTIRGNKGGSVVVNCQGQSEDTGDFLSRLLKNQIAPDVVRAALRDEDADSFWLYWPTLQVDTKLTLTDFAPTVLFLWRRGGASSSHLEYVLKRLSNPREEREASATLKEADEYLLGLSPGTIIRVSDLIQRFGLTRDQSFGLVTPKVADDRFAMRLRVKTSRRLLDHDNVWVTTREQLPISVTDEDENEINLLDPKNIEVAYERIG